MGLHRTDKSRALFNGTHERRRDIDGLFITPMLVSVKLIEYTNNANDLRPQNTACSPRSLLLYYSHLIQ